MALKKKPVKIREFMRCKKCDGCRETKLMVSGAHTQKLSAGAPRKTARKYYSKGGQSNASLSFSLMQKCPACNGEGRVRNPEFKEVVPA